MKTKLISSIAIVIFLIACLSAFLYTKKFSEVELLKNRNAEMAAEMSRVNNSGTTGKYPLTEVQSLKLQIALKEALLAKHNLDILAEVIRTQNKIPANVQFDEMRLEFHDPVQVSTDTIKPVK